MAKAFKYSAFISYSHADGKMVGWLHKALENYRVPKNLAGRETGAGLIPTRLKPFFRDRDDLSASTDLGASVRSAMKNSEFMIVVCSPEAAASAWVNQEIEEFTRLRSPDKILCLIVAGEPHMSKIKGREHEECFPPALRKLSGKKNYEPIAADARPEGDGKRLAKLKLISGILGIELDRLIQRDAQRRHQRQVMGLAASTLIIVALSVLLFVAVEARKEAEEARYNAEEKRAQAEEMVDFMLDDLKTKLEPIGNLQLMDDIAMQALGYYASIDVDELGPESLSRRAEVLQMIGEIEHQRGNLDLARNIFEQAFLTTEELLSLDPENPDRIFDHSQSIYWLAYTNLNRGDLTAAEQGFREYADYSLRLAKINPGNLDWQIEVGYAYSNLAAVYGAQGRYEDAQEGGLKALAIFQGLADAYPESADFAFEVAQSLAWLSDVNMNLGNLDLARGYREREGAIYENILSTDPQNNFIKSAFMVSKIRLARVSAFLGEVSAAKSNAGKGMALADELIMFDPENTWPIENLAAVVIETLENMSEEFTERDRNELLARAIALSSSLTSRDASNVIWQSLYFRSLTLDAKHRIADGQIAGGIEAARTAYAGLQALWRDNQDNYRLLGPLGYAGLILAEGQGANGESQSAKAVLEGYVEVAQIHEGRMDLRARDYLARAQYLSGNQRSAKEIRDFLTDLGYRSPDFRLFWGNER